MFMKRNLMKITIMGSESGHISSVFAYTRLLISHWTEVVLRTVNLTHTILYHRLQTKAFAQRLSTRRTRRWTSHWSAARCC